MISKNVLASLFLMLVKKKLRNGFIKDQIISAQTYLHKYTRV